jgi:hypothetical protein
MHSSRSRSERRGYRQCSVFPLNGFHSPAIRSADDVPSRQDDDLGSLGRALVEMDHILVDHPDAAGRHVSADRLRFRGAMNALGRAAEASAWARCIEQSAEERSTGGESRATGKRDGAGRKAERQQRAARDRRHGRTPDNERANGLLLSEEGQNHLALVAEKADEAVGLVGFVALEIGVAHDHHLDRRVTDVGVGL